MTISTPAATCASASFTRPASRDDHAARMRLVDHLARRHTERADHGRKGEIEDALRLRGAVPLAAQGQKLVLRLVARGRGHVIAHHHVVEERGHLARDRRLRLRARQPAHLATDVLARHQ